MSPLGFGVLFVISFALGISWLAWEFDARIGRRRLSASCLCRWMI